MLFKYSQNTSSELSICSYYVYSYVCYGRTDIMRFPYYYHSIPIHHPTNPYLPDAYDMLRYRLAIVHVCPSQALRQPLCRLCIALGYEFIFTLTLFSDDSVCSPILQAFTSLTASVLYYLYDRQG